MTHGSFVWNELYTRDVGAAKARIGNRRAGEIDGLGAGIRRQRGVQRVVDARCQKDRPVREALAE